MPNLFPISLEVEEVAVGRVLRRLSGMEGVARVHLNLQSAKQLAAPVREDDDDIEEAQNELRAAPLVQTGGIDGRRRKRSPPKQNEFFRTIASVLLKTPAHRKMLVAALERVGLTGKGIDGLINRMGTLGLVKRTAPGTYRLSKKGERMFGSFGSFGLSEPTQKLLAGQPKPRGVRQIDNHSGARKVMLEALANKSTMTPMELAKALTEHNLSAGNYASTGRKMRQEGLIEHKDGRFSITERGREVISTPPSNELDHSPHTEEEGLSSHG